MHAICMGYDSSESYFVFSSYLRSTLQFRDDYFYEINDQDFFKLPFRLDFGDQLPIRPVSSGLSGYRVQDTPLDGDDLDEEQNSAFDANIDVSDWANPNEADISFGQDLNNNIETLDDIPPPALDGAENEVDDSFALSNLSKGEYSYRAYENIRNYWAGPSYWKLARRPNSVKDNQTTTAHTEHGRRAIRNNKKKPTFTTGDESSDDSGCFIAVNSQIAKTIRQCNYRRWSSDKLKLPTQCNMSKELFHFYQFCPSFDIFRLHHTEEIREIDIQNNNNDDDDFPVSFIIIIISLFCLFAMKINLISVIITLANGFRKQYAFSGRNR